MAANPDNPIRTRRSLLERLKNWEDQDSWTDFTGIYRGLIHGFARQQGLTEVEAEEVVQETFISVAKKIRSFEYDPAVGSFKSWLMHTTQWRIHDQFRKRRKAAAAVTARSTRTGGGTSTIEKVADPAGLKLEEAWDQEWERNILDVALKKVRQQANAREYQIFDLYVIQQTPVREVAQTLGVPVGRVYLAKHRVSKLLKREVKALRQSAA